LRLRHFLPLLGFALPTLVIGYGFVIPGSCIARINALSIGFGTTVLGACLAYIAGLRSALYLPACSLPRKRRDAAS
jgi:ABC-type Fe3+ transport system permease subunit